MILISNNGEGLPLLYRMSKEGAGASAYVHSFDLEKSYDGIIDKIKPSDLKRASLSADVIIFDLNRINENTARDASFLRSFGVKGENSVFGAVADKLRKSGKWVVGPSPWTDALEFDRNFGAQIARRVGLDIPEMNRFKSIGEAKKFLEKSDKLWVLKPNNNADLDLTYVEKYPGEILQKLNGDLKGRLRGNFCIQEKIDGVEVSTEGWFDGREWSCFNHTIESKRMMNADLGPAIGSQSNTVWIEPKPKIMESFEKLTPMLQKCGYVGPIDINAIYKGGKSYFLEWTPRFGYDALYNLVTLLGTSLSDFLGGDFSGAEFKPGFSCSERISIPPYPYSDGGLVKKYALDIPVKCKLDEFFALDVYRDGSIKCAGGDGIIGVCAEPASSISGAFGNVYRYMKDNVKIGSYIQHRTDAARKHQKRFDDYYGQEV